MIAVIGGSELYRLERMTDCRSISVDTPYGAPSAPLVMGQLRGRPLLFLARHGERHHLPPHRVNYRANIRALRDQGASQIVAVATVGGITGDFAPGVIALPDQILDYTHGRAMTYYDGEPQSEQGVKHIARTCPYTSAEPMPRRRARVWRRRRRSAACAATEPTWWG
jgi:5'-methylthioinosine phosphorylase